MYRTLILVSALFLGACTTADTVAIPQYRANPIIVPDGNPALAAYAYYGMNEITHRAELSSFTGVDPRRTEWCAAFVNAVLEESGLTSNNSHEHPLLARSFLDWGTPVAKEDIQPGDIVVFPRGNVSWQGHVGIYLRTVENDGKKYYYILGGNQNNSVSVVAYRSTYAIGIRRPESI